MKISMAAGQRSEVCRVPALAEYGQLNKGEGSRVDRGDSVSNTLLVILSRVRADHDRTGDGQRVPVDEDVLRQFRWWFRYGPESIAADKCPGQCAPVLLVTAEHPHFALALK